VLIGITARKSPYIITGITEIVIPRSGFTEIRCFCFGGCGRGENSSYGQKTHRGKSNWVRDRLGCKRVIRGLVGFVTVSSSSVNQKVASALGLGYSSSPLATSNVG